MSIEAMTLVLHHSRLKGTFKLVLLGVANHEGDGGAWPSVETLATYANCSEREVQRALRAAEAAGELRTYIQQGGTPETPAERRTNRYEVLVTCPPDCDGTKHHRVPRPRRAPDDEPPTRRVPAQSTAHGGGDTTVTPPVTPPSPPPVTPPSPEPSIEPPPEPRGVTSQGDPPHARGKPVDNPSQASPSVPTEILDRVAAVATDLDTLLDMLHDGGVKRRRLRRRT